MYGIVSPGHDEIRRVTCPSERLGRLRVDPVRRTVRITSDNPAYDPIGGVKPDEIKLFSKVIGLAASSKAASANDAGALAL
jgi:hypothetical protein